MLNAQEIEAAQADVEIDMAYRLKAFGAELAMVVNAAAMSGSIQMTMTQERVVATVTEEYILRAALCAEAFIAQLTKDNLAPVGETGEQIKTLVADALAAHVDDIGRAHAGAVTIVGSRGTLRSFDDCREEALTTANGRIDAALARVLTQP
jgi:hypothetical protein